MSVTLDTPVVQLPGIGQARAQKLEKLGLKRCSDLLFYYPRDYEDRREQYTIRQAPSEHRVCISAMVAEHPRRTRIRKGLELVQLKVADHTGVLHLTFFNQGYVEKALHIGEEYIFFGKVEEQGRRRTMTNPIFEPAQRQSITGCIMPIYRLTAGISSHFLASLVRQCLPCAALLSETLPQSVRQDYGLAGLEFSVQTIHFPPHLQALESARQRLIFEELFYLSLGLSFLKRRRCAVASHGCIIPSPPWEQFQPLLPFSPTQAQMRVMEEISADLSSGRPMNRLVQGDVGSGKTAVAAYAIWLAAKAGYQAALMAPTEVLAEQHFRTLSTFLAPSGIRIALLTGSLSPAEKKRVHQGLAEGSIDLAVGTQALISQSVSFRRLALIVADEQHRFGVAQRSALAGKSEGAGLPPPHVLVMSATPIPRTLALIIYGDLDVSILDQLPPGRTPVETYVIGEDKRLRMYQFIRRQVEQGRQVYIVCPAVDDNSDSLSFGEPTSPEGLKAVTSYAHQLQSQVFPELSVGILHGKLRPREKEAVMAAFARGEIAVLVSTTVIEVGVDVPNATLMIVEDADRFGLSQLHQLRGRVGRGKHQSYCILVSSKKNSEALHRLRILASTRDGFQIAEEDLKLRGPGDFFGNRQHGLPQLKLADLSGDIHLFQQAQQAAQNLLHEDPTLSQIQNQPVLERIRRLFADTPDIFN
ncbi:MAG: ATP-dependent DNA helicase RecG [Lawsonibacter sp.]|jgi:ATP-dependent DNA helicase RecG